MTYVFDMQVGKVLIGTDMPEWEKRFPVPGPKGEKAVEIVNAWKNGTRKSLFDEMPRELITRKPRKSWPDAFQTTNGLLVVSDAAKSVLERLDPETHQFFPLSLRSKSGAEIEGPWFSMNVTATQDSILVERSRILTNPRAPDRLCSFYPDTKPEYVVIDSERQSGWNFWREMRFQGSLLGSDTLIEALHAENIRFFPSIKTTDVSQIKQ